MRTSLRSVPAWGADRAALRRVDHLHVVEIDRDIVTRLKQWFPAGQLTIHEGDALRFDFGSLLRYPGDCLHVVGNLPYNISTPLLFHLANFAERVVDMHFMLQKEVVERMVAIPGTTDYGRLSVMLQYRFVIDWLIDVPPESFDPAPKVDSAVVRLIPRPPAELDARDEAKFSALVAAALSQRRKMLRNTLRDFFAEAELAGLRHCTDSACRGVVGGGLCPVGERARLNRFRTCQRLRSIVVSRGQRSCASTIP